MPGGGFFRDRITNKGELEKLISKYKKPELCLPKEVCQYDLNGNFVQLFPSIVGLKKHGYNPRAVLDVLKHRNAKSSGYFWIFRSELPEVIPDKIKVPTNGNWSPDEILIKE